MEKNKTRMTTLRWILFGVNITLLAIALVVWIWQTAVDARIPSYIAYAAIIVLSIPFVIISWPIGWQKQSRSMRLLALLNVAVTLSFGAVVLVDKASQLPPWVFSVVWVAFMAWLVIFLMLNNKIQGAQRAAAAQETKGETPGDGAK